MDESSSEVWESSQGGIKCYGAYGPRDVLIIVSREPGDGEEVVQMQEGRLAQEDRERLSSEGVPCHCWSEDVKLMEVRYLKCRRFHSVSVENSPSMKIQHVISRIISLFRMTTKPGVDIAYIGPGRRNSGDWCFTDGFITFETLMNLYTHHFTGKTLTICSVCSYSGHWVDTSKRFLEKLGIQPCGHSARKAGIMLKVYSSCLPDQVGNSLLYFARSCGNDKNTGALFLRGDSEIAPDQSTCSADFTRVTCGRSFDEECGLSREFSFSKREEMDHVYLLRWKKRGRMVWQYVLLMEAPEVVELLEERLSRRYLRSRSVDVRDYGVVLRSGVGKEPPQETKEWLRRLLMGLETLQY